MYKRLGISILFIFTLSGCIDAKFTIKEPLLFVSEQAGTPKKRNTDYPATFLPDVKKTKVGCNNKIRGFDGQFVYEKVERSFPVFGDFKPVKRNPNELILQFLETREVVERPGQKNIIEDKRVLEIFHPQRSADSIAYFRCLFEAQISYKVTGIVAIVSLDDLGNKKFQQFIQKGLGDVLAKKNNALILSIIKRTLPNKFVPEGVDAQRLINLVKDKKKIIWTLNYTFDSSKTTPEKITLKWADSIGDGSLSK